MCLEVNIAREHAVRVEDDATYRGEDVDEDFEVEVVVVDKEEVANKE
jgi:hypothetical protein